MGEAKGVVVDPSKKLFTIYTLKLFLKKKLFKRLNIHMEITRYTRSKSLYLLNKKKI